MKTFPLCLFMAAMVFFTQAGYAQVSEQDLLTEAQRDYIRNDLDAAKERFQLVLEIDPHNITAQNYLRMIETAQNKNGRNGALEKALAALVVPRVQLKAATLDTALEYLKQTAEKISDGKTKVNFVVEIPDEIVAAKRVTLDLSSVPFTVVLHYVSEQTGVQFSIDKYAITVKLPSAQPAPAASGSDTPAAPDTATQQAEK